MFSKLIFFPFMFAFIIISINQVTNYYHIQPVSNTIDNKTVIIDPGHGGKDPGTVYGEMLEKNLTLEIAKRVEQKLLEQGINVVLTRELDSNLVSNSTSAKVTQQQASLLKRLNISAQKGGSTFISIHVNSNENTSFYGTQTYYRPDDSKGKLLAEKIQSEMLKVRTSSRKAIPSSPGEIFLLDNSPMPATIVEVGFISNNEDRQLLSQEAYRDLIAQAIARGIQNFLAY